MFSRRAASFARWLRRPSGAIDPLTGRFGVRTAARPDVAVAGEVVTKTPTPLRAEVAEARPVARPLGAGVAALGSFRFPVSASDDARLDPAAREASDNERLRRAASARRDDDIARRLGERFSRSTLDSFHSPLRKHLTLDPLISEYSIDSPEGVALMQLAEALIRSPAAAKSYMPSRLINDTLSASHLDFMSHVGGDKSMLINASSVALSTVRNLLLPGDAPADERARGVAARGSHAALRESVILGLGALANKFTMGADIDSALRRATRAERRNSARMHSFDMLGEGARTAEDAARYLESYASAGRAIATSGARSPQMSVKLSSLSPRFDELSRGSTVDQLALSLGSLLPESAKGGAIDLDREYTVFVDAEEQNRLEMTLSAIEAAVAARAPPVIGVVVQAYGRRAMETLEHLRELAVRYPSTKFRVRLVKGAYWDAEVKEAQLIGADTYPVWTSKRQTDVSYLACASYLLDHPDHLPAPAFATHNARTVADVLSMLDGDFDEFSRRGCEFQRLHGMGESFDYGGLATRVYAPVGAPEDLLAYLVRRLLENGANSSFLRRVADGRDDLMNVDVLAPGSSDADAGSGVPPSPRDVYGGSRLSARGVDHEHPDFPARFAATPAYAPRSSPVFAAAEPEWTRGLLERLRAFDPADEAEREASPGASTRARADVLRRAADFIEARTESMAKLIMEEAGKTLVDAVNEVRECVDFFRFYALRADAVLAEPERLRTVTGETCVMRAHPRGPWLCVGPFNFPFAIVGGLASSAYVAGNPVVIKPHPSTPKCAAALVDALLASGADPEVITVVADSPSKSPTAIEPGTSGSDAGALLVDSGAFAGVSFVGSTKTAARINHRLATNALERDEPIARLVAETGGLNVLVADASALPEQVSDAVIASFAQSAGQRCSSARALVLDAGCAEEVLRMLSGALDELRVSTDVLNLSTDVGPLISEAAAEKARDHCARLEAAGAKVVARCPGEDRGALFHPRALVLAGDDPVKALDALKEEIFAPVLHVVVYDGSLGELRRVIDAANAKGFALTGGVLTRCDSVKALVTNRLNCGNAYVNRDVVGAVVESQPFGGHGKSGNGVKAGSEGYLEQFVSRKVVCEDTTAGGGNVELLRASS